MNVFGGAFLLGVAGKARALLFQLRCKKGGRAVRSDRRERAAAGAAAEAPATDPGNRQ